MSREIKFRARIVFSGRWAYFGLYNNELLEGEIEKETLGQFTGLKDKNGKEIYEGDVIRLFCHEECKDVIAEVKFYRSTWRYFTDRDTQGQMIELAWEISSDKNYSQHLCEIIGNIYDNPELLK